MPCRQGRPIESEITTATVASGALAQAVAPAGGPRRPDPAAAARSRPARRWRHPPRPRPAPARAGSRPPAGCRAGRPPGPSRRRSPAAGPPPGRPGRPVGTGINRPSTLDTIFEVTTRMSPSASQGAHRASSAARSSPGRSSPMPSTGLISRRGSSGHRRHRELHAASATIAAVTSSDSSAGRGPAPGRRRCRPVAGRGPASRPAPRRPTGRRRTGRRPRPRSRSPITGRQASAIPRTGAPPMIGDSPTTGARAARSAVRMPGTARMVLIDTTGLDGAIRISSACAIASRHARRRLRRRPRRPGRTSSAGSSARWRTHHSWKWIARRPPSALDHHVGLAALVGHRQQPDAGLPALAQRRGDVGQRVAGVQHLGADQVGGDVEVAEAEPARFGAVGGQLLRDPPALTGPSPAAFGVVRAGQGVHHAVQVGADPQAVQGDVVAGVDDRGDVGIRVRPAHTLQEPGTADAAGQHHDPHALQPTRFPYRPGGGQAVSPTSRKVSSWAPSSTALARRCSGRS